MSASTPPPPSKGSSTELGPSQSANVSDSISNASEGEHSTRGTIPALNEPGRGTPEPVAPPEIPIPPGPYSQVRDADTEMSDSSPDHNVSVKQEKLTPSGPPQGDAYPKASVLAKCEKVEIKTEVASEVKSEIKTEVESQIQPDFEHQSSGLKISDLTEPAQKPNENEGGTAEKQKQPRRTPAKTALEYHKRKQEDAIGGVRKVRKIILNVSPGKLLQNIAQDPVAAYNSGPSNGVAPVMQVSTKKGFMDEILSKCPKEDFQKFKTELNILDEESRSFGFKRMEMKNGMWMLKGMNSCRSCHISLLL